MMRHLLWMYWGLVLVAAVSPAFAETYIVRPEGTGDFPTIQAAIDAVTDGDVIELTDGTFTGNGNRDIDYLGRAITVRSQSGNPELCVIDCQGSETAPRRAFHFHSWEAEGSILEGVTIRNGHREKGGGILCYQALPTILNCSFIDNYAWDAGGAVCCNSAYPSLVDCSFSANSARLMGGGVYCEYSDVTFTGCSFLGNTAGWHGGGLQGFYSYLAVHHCTFSDNVSGDYGGGGFYSSPSWDTGVLIEDCTFVGNRTSGSGGGVFGGSPMAVFDCDFRDNTAGGDGGGVVSVDATALVESCRFGSNAAGHNGGGIKYVGSGGTLRGCTIAANSASQGGAVGCSNCTVTIENTIIALNSVGTSIGCQGICHPSFACCDLYGNAGGDWIGNFAWQEGINGNFSADPLFCGPVGGYTPMIHAEAPGYSLHGNSPCLPGNHPDGYDCSLIGVHGQGCGITTLRFSVEPEPAGGSAAVEISSWGLIKSRFR